MARLLQRADLGAAKFLITNLTDNTLDDNYTESPYCDADTEKRSERNDLRTHDFTKVASDEERLQLLKQWRERFSKPRESKGYR